METLRIRVSSETLRAQAVGHVNEGDAALSDGQCNTFHCALFQFSHLSRLSIDAHCVLGVVTAAVIPKHILHGPRTCLLRRWRSKPVSHFIIYGHCSKRNASVA